MSSKKHLNKFTLNINDETEKHILKDISNIKKVLLLSIKNILGIYLVGGFGRGEGSVIVLKKKIHVINDYDLVVIFKDNISSEEKNIVNRKLKDKITIRQIDITYYNYKVLSKLKNTIYNYDFKNHAKIIYQEKDYISLIPEFNKKFKMFEAYLPLEVYMSALILSLPPKINFNNLNKSKKFWITHQISKSIIGWSLTDMIANNLYEPLYSNRYEVLKKIYLKRNQKNKIELVKFALDFKLSTNYEIDLELDKLWFQSKKIHIDTLINKFFVFFNLKIPLYFFKFKIKNIFRYLYGILFNQKKYYEYSNLFLSKLFFLLSINENYLDKYNFQLCIKYCKKIGLNKKKNYSVDEILTFLKDKDPNCLQFMQTNEDFVDE